MGSQRKRQTPAASFEFDAAQFARSIAEARREQELSTRELAHLAGISQAYVVALERPRIPGNGPGPTPTVDVVARLAFAFGIDVVALFARSMRPSGRHVLFVVDRPGRHAFQDVRSRAGSTVGTWVTTTREKPVVANSKAGPHTLRLRINVAEPYETKRIEQSLRAELQRLAPLLGGAPIGFVFDEMSAVLGAIDDPQVVIDEEHHWAKRLNDAAAEVGVHAMWNICVYEFAAIESLPDPVSATIELVASHDTVWDSHDGRVAEGDIGVQRILTRLRPDDVSPRAWRATVDDGVARSRLRAS